MTAGDHSPVDPLQFETTVPTAGPTITCSACHQPIADQYWSAGVATVCARCRETIAASQAADPALVRRGGRFLRAFVFGCGGMLAGALVWYLVAKLANIEAALIAILIGWLVGRAVFIGSGRRGGLRYQLLAVALTYAGYAIAYAPFVVQDFAKRRPAVVADSAGAPSAAASPSAPASERRIGFVGAVTALAMVVAAILALPVIVTVGAGFPGALLSLLIYGFGLFQAWKLTRWAGVMLDGPFRIGASGAPA